ncbi:MAG: sugar nucleotide-binding protein [Cyanobacteriota bacterium]
MLRLHRERGASGQALGVVKDQVGCPTSTATLAAACWRVITADVQEPVLHGCDAGAASCSMWPWRWASWRWSWVCCSSPLP